MVLIEAAKVVIINELAENNLQKAPKTARRYQFFPKFAPRL